MGYITGSDRSQGLLLPESLEEYIGRDHSVRFLDAFVDGLDLAQCGFGRTKPADTGRPPFSPGDLLKLYLWGYLNQTRSSRRLERECARNLEVIWLLRKLQPDFKTIADFRKDNAKAFKMVFRQFNLLCRELDLFGRELVAIDGTKLKAVNNPARNHTKSKLRDLLGRMDARLEEYLGAMDEADNQEQSAGADNVRELQKKIGALRERQRRHQETLEKLELSGESEVSLTDPDSRNIWKSGIGYNAQIAVDDKHKLIIAQEVVNDKTDYWQLAPMAQAAKEELGVETIKAVADGGYYERNNIAACEAHGVEAYVPRALKGSAAFAGRFDKTQFHYEATHDTYTCPAGATLEWESQTLKDGEPHFIYSHAKACRQCLLKAQCTPADYRRIMRWEGEAALDRMHPRVAAAPELIKRRKELVEHPFGSIKFWMNQHAFLMRGFVNVRAEFSLTTLAYNIKRVLNIVGVEKLLKALRKRSQAINAPPSASPAFQNKAWSLYSAFWRPGTSSPLTSSLLALCS